MRTLASLLLVCIAGLAWPGLAAGQGMNRPAEPLLRQAAPAAPEAAPSAPEVPAEEPGLAPLAAALKANYSTLWSVVKAARLEKLFDDRTARMTVLAPTNEAWLKRLPSLTAGANLTVAQLLSDGRARVLEQILNYHVLPGRPLESLEQLSLRGRLPSNANSCSTAKNVEVVAAQPTGKNAGQVTLASSMGGTAQTVGPPTPVTGGSFIFPIDDVLLPASITLPFESALAGPGDLGRSALDAASLAALAAQLKGKEPLPLTDDAGLAARDKAAEGANSVPVGGGEPGPAAPQQPARRRVTVPTLPPAVAEEEGAVTSPPAVASMGDRGGPTQVVP